MAPAATAWMFPWERRQMAGGKKLTTWEKIYWGAFAGGMSLLAFNHLRPKTKKEVEVRTAGRLWAPTPTCV